VRNGSGALAVIAYATKDVGYDPQADMAPVCLLGGLNHVPFRGGGPAMNDLMAGHVSSLIASTSTATGFMREGRIRALAVTGAKRSPFDPDIPTIAEQGFPGYAATNWYAAAVSSKVPPEMVATLSAILTRALNAPEVRTAYGQQGMETLASTQAEVAAHIARETEIWKKVIADAGIRLDRQSPGGAAMASSVSLQCPSRLPPVVEARLYRLATNRSMMT